MKKASKRWQSLLSVFLTAMLLVQMLPAQAFAVNSETTASAEANASIAEDAVILGEIVAEREEYVKRFKMSDGTIQAVQYEIPVHYQTEDGSWVDYDKTLTEGDALEEDALLSETTSVDEGTSLSEETQPENEVSADETELETGEEQLPSGDEVPAEGDGETTVEPSGTETDVPAEETVTGEDEVGAAVDENETEAGATAEEETVIAPVEQVTLEPEAPAATPTAEEEVAVVDDEIESVSTETEEVTTKEWINLSPDFAVRFSKKTNGKKFVRVEVDGHALAWSYQDANKVEGVVVESEVSDDPLVLTNVRSSVVYPGAFNNADLEYLLQPGSLKENIVLQNADAASVYTLEYKYNTLTAVQVDEHTVEFQDSDGAVVYVLYAPYMTDANGETSAALTLEITKNKKNSCTIEMVAEEDWLQDETRVYPVTLDPLLMTSQAWSDEDCCQSCFISSANPDTSYGRGGTEYLGSMYAGYYSAYGKMRTLIKVATLPTIGVGDKVVHAELAAYVRYCYPINTVSAYRVTTDWTQSTATWNSNITFDSIVRDYQIVPSIERTETGVDRWEIFDITDLARGWYSGDYPNYGIMLRSNYESSTTGAHVQFYSSGLSNNSTVRPMLIIYYRNMTGYEDYWSYTSVGAGRDGTASVNNYNGNFTFTQPITLDAGGTLMPVSISAVYNSTAVSASYSSLGLGFQTNYHIYIAENPNLDDDSTPEEQKYKYYFNDADGTDHYFYFENLTDTTAKDEDGLGYTLTVNSSSTSARFTITDKTGNKMIFNDQKKLVKIQNTDSITNVVAYDTNGRISTITDGAGRIYTFAYTDTTATSTIQSITDPAGRATFFTYSSGKLTKVTFPDSKTVLLSYSSNLLYYIKGIDTTSQVYIAYTNAAAKPIAYVQVGPSSGPLEKYTFSYLQNETTITDLQGRSYAYQFNDFGQTTGIVSNTDGRAVFMEYYEPTDETDVRTNKLLSESRVQFTTQNNFKGPSCTSNWNFDLVSTAYWPVCEVMTGYGHEDNYSLLIAQGTSESGISYAAQSVSLPAGTYTLSAYLSTRGGESGDYTTVKADVLNGTTVEATYNLVSGSFSTGDGEWIRKSVTFELSDARTVRFVAGQPDGGSGLIYVDDIQLEAGKVDSKFNRVGNNGYNNNTLGAVSTTHGYMEETGVAGFERCAYVIGSPTEQRNIIHSITSNGSAGDVFSFGAWVKAHSAPTGGELHGTDPAPVFQLMMVYYNDSTIVGSETIEINCDVSSWQFVSAESIAPADYTSAAIALVYNYNVNTAYMTGAYCYKEQYGQTYTYDEDGNIVSAVDLAETESTFQYGTNNMLTKLVNPSGSSYEYTYNAKNQLTQAVSSDGQTYDFTYDNKGNALSSVISSSQRTPTTSLTAGCSYYIVNAHSGALLTLSDDLTTLTTEEMEIGSENQIWRLGGTDTDGVFYIRHTTVGVNSRLTETTAVSGGENLSLSVSSATAGSSIDIVASGVTTAEQFALQQTSDDTFGIFSSTVCLDGQYGSNTIEMGREVKLSSGTLSTLTDGQQWYFYPVDDDNSYFITSSATYTSDQNFLSTLTDQRGNTTSYSYDATKGTLLTTTDPRGTVTTYAYNALNNQLTSVSAGDQTVSYTYASDRLYTISVNGDTTYSFAYDNLGRNTGISVGSTVLAAYTYTDNLLTQQTYANGATLNFAYDNLDRLSSRWYNSSSYKLEYLYGANGELATVLDYAVSTRTKYVYDLADRIVSTQTYNTTSLNGTNLLSSVDYTYADETNYLTGMTHYSNLIGTQTIEYRYGDQFSGEMPDQIYGVSWNGTERLSLTYDPYGRISQRILKPTADEATWLYDQYFYLPGASQYETTSLVGTYITPNRVYEYTYDANGNITLIMDGYNSLSYEYDDLNQLVRESNEAAEYTSTYTYENGNITSKATTIDGVTTTQTWTYGDSSWGDLLTEYSDGTSTYTVASDPSGNIISISDGTNGIAHTWLGRILQNSVVVEDGTRVVVYYTYDSEGRRISKRVGSNSTFYTYNGDILAGVTIGSKDLAFMYDEAGTPFGFIYNDSANYYYEKNLQGDIVGILDETGTRVVEYTYDAWGKPLSIIGTAASTIGQYNPLRYRGYVYDTETGYYYLNSRYYDPELCRFISADCVIGATGDMTAYNLFSYCGNNPVNRIDGTGTLWTIIRALDGILHGANTIAVWWGVDTAAIGAAFLCMSKDSSGTYHADFFCWQAGGGYIEIYDAIFDLATSMDSREFPFNCGGEKYTLWLWKGDYINLGAGAEVGIYSGGFGMRTVNYSLAMYMRVIVRYKGKTISNYQTYSWWVTTFNPEYINVRARDLSVTYKIGFSGPRMYNAFKAKWGTSPGWTFFDVLNMAQFSF